MFHTLRLVITVALLGCAAAAYADPPARVGRLNHAAGAVSFAPAEAPDQWTQAALNRPLTAGDRLWADNGGRAEFHIGSTAVRLGARTSLDVLNLNDDTLQFRLAQGAANIRVRHLDPGDTVEIATPAGAVLIREPGSYRVSVDPQSDSSRVVVNFGRAQVVTATQSFNVPSSQAVSFAPNMNPAFELAAYAGSDEFDRWSAERDRREDRIVSTRYVSPHMTGYEDLDEHGTWRTLPEYGAVWVPTRVASGWAPYRHGHWVWVSPWGWTWVDDAPWGYAPSHYGRWVWTGGYWAWAPGRVVARPVYAPALVAFVGGSHFHVRASSGPAVGWFPLGWRDPYIPSYRASPTYVRNVNVTHVTNVTNITNMYNNPAAANRVNFANRNNPDAVTVVSRQAFASARPVAQSTVRVAPTELAKAEVVQAKPPAEPERASVARQRTEQRPPATVAAREVVAVTAPAKPTAQASLTSQDTAAAQQRRPEHEPRVRVIGRERAEAKAADKASPPTAEKAAPQNTEKGAPQIAGSTTPATPTAPKEQPPKETPAVVSAPPAAARVQAQAQAQPSAREPEQRETRREERREERRAERREQRVAAPPEAPQRPVPAARSEPPKVAGPHVEPPRPQAQPLPPVARPEPARPQSQPSVARPEPARVQPQPPAARPEPARAQPQPPVARAEAPRAQPQPPVARHEPPRAQPRAEPARARPPQQEPAASQAREPQQERRRAERVPREAGPRPGAPAS